MTISLIGDASVSRLLGLKSTEKRMESSKKIGRKGRGRPRGFDEAEALESAMVAFWRAGYTSTSLDDLVAATGASRASLYGVFGDKRALFEQCLVLYGAHFSDRIAAALHLPMSGRERIAVVLKASADRLTSSEAPPGCLRCNSTLELMGEDQAMDRALKGANALFVSNIARLIRRAVEDREIAPDRAPSLTLFFTSVVNGMVTLARSGASRDDLADVIETALTVWSGP